ncbi:hypothetical protein QYM36_007697 [Artemia franciscana]|uniref:Uncharacterized protein n=1 Tax=Artemia franciscana TaxID=6661 RepID=A0AA88LLT6_ARTSF|nr:hypothetical protein QYM36_007697 [Artemia franciscana]
MDNMSLSPMKLESKENDKHLVMWNVKVQDEVKAHELLSKVVTEGLDLPASSPAKLVDFRENVNFLKFELPSKAAVKEDKGKRSRWIPVIQQTALIKLINDIENVDWYEVLGDIQDANSRFSLYYEKLQFD